MPKIKTIAIYLPQFHPIPENNEWWGNGFTEWTNVTKAKPQFFNHYQPHLPADLGFYDLRLHEARLAQEALAKQFNIYGFCYYHYWFSGRRLLEKPIKAKLANKKEDLPFMLCWANENWTRIWDGGDKQVLLEQRYSEEDDLLHIEELIKYFLDDRYIKVNGKPFFVIYKPKLFPDVRKTIDTWRRYCIERGFDLFIGCMLGQDEYDFKADGFDVGIQFQPFYYKLDSINLETFSQKLYRKFFTRKPSFFYTNRVYDYTSLVDRACGDDLNDRTVIHGITPGWDNTSRRKSNITVYVNSTPDLFRKWASNIKTKLSVGDDSFVFINAWNEWAEGNHLEPCLKWGTQYLEVVKEIFGND